MIFNISSIIDANTHSEMVLHQIGMNIAHILIGHYNHKSRSADQESNTLETHIIDNDKNIGANPSRLHPGTMLDKRYLIQSLVGRGGMAGVYCARDMHFPNTVKLVAVKEMMIQTDDSFVRDSILKNFEREANILGGLSHPCIPHIADYFTKGDRSYLILEYVQRTGFGKDFR